MMNMREAVEVILAGRKAAIFVGHQFIINDIKLHNLGFSRNDISEIRRHALEIEDMLHERMNQIPDWP